jgi:signal recognition particle subunit SRP54
MGSMDKLLKMVPGMSGMANKIPKAEMEKQERKMARWKNAISSMTEEEIENPEVLDNQTGRIQRIAKGSGTSGADIRSLLKQYKLLKDMMGMQGAAEGLAEGKMDKKMMARIAKSMKGSKMKF